MFTAAADQRHVKYKIGPWRGLETNVVDKTFSNKGALATAQDLIFAKVIEGKGTGTEARVRPGRSDWNNDSLLPRFYLAEMESGEAGWTNGTATATKAYAGYGSRYLTSMGAGTQAMYRTFTGIDITQGGLNTGLGDKTLDFWVFTGNPASFTDASCFVELTSDVGPGAPGSWVNTLTAAGNVAGWLPRISTINSNTWTKISVPLSAFTSAGTFDPTSITGIDISMTFSAGATIWFDEIYIESPVNANTVGLGEFLKATTGDRYLVAKNGDTLFIDKNHSGSFTKVKSGMLRNAMAYMAKVYNQMFVADGDTMTAIDGTLNAEGAYNWRPMGFPTPPVGGVSATNVGSGSNSTAGTHQCFLSYIYGNGSTTYGQSSMAFIGAVTIGAGDKFSFSSLPVPPESAGVITLRLWIGLAGDSNLAPAYFAIDVAAGTTSATVDLSDATLSAATNPSGPRDNGVPPVAKYILPFAGSLVYMRLANNPTGLTWSRAGVDINSGPEIVSATALAITQRGEPWTGGIVRGGILYCFTRRSIQQATYDQFGNLNVIEIDQSLSGNSVSVGAIDQNAIWSDETGNIYFQSEYGIQVLRLDGKIISLSKLRLYDEWLDVNNTDSTNSFNFRSVSSATEWAAGSYASATNLVAASGSLTYQYQAAAANNQNVQTTLGAQTQAGSDFQYVFAGGNRLGDVLDSPSPNAFGANANVLASGGTWYILGQALVDTVISGAILMARKGNNAPQLLTMGIYKYHYEFGPPPAGGFVNTETGFVGANVTQANVTNTGSTDQMLAWPVSFGTVVIPKGEYFWFSITNNSGSPVKPQLTDLATLGNSNIKFYPNPTSNMYVQDSPTLSWQSGTVCTPGIQLNTQPVSYSQMQVVGDYSTAIQRFATFVPPTNPLLATASRQVFMETSPDNVNWGHGQTIWLDKFTNIGDPIQNFSSTPFYALPDYNPNTTDPTYPTRRQPRWARFTMTFQGNSVRGSQVQQESDSLVSTSLSTSFLSVMQWQMFTCQEYLSTFTAPYISDTWTSPAYNLGATPSSWGRFAVSFTQAQQKIQMQARTDTVPNFGNAPQWYTISMNSIPTFNDLPINGQYVQIRFTFMDDQNHKSGLVSAIQSFEFSYMLSGQANLQPLTPPCAAYFNRYHLLAYAASMQTKNSQAWCISPGDQFAMWYAPPGEKFSKWTNQPVNCFCIYDNKLLAGRNGSGKISQYWNEDWQDDGAGLINGYLVSMPTAMGADNIKSIMGLVVTAGVREFQGLNASALLNPNTNIPAVSTFVAGLFTGSQDNAPITPPGPVGFNFVATPYADQFLGLLKRESHSTPFKVPVVGGDTFFFDIARQDAIAQCFWSAFAHQIKDNSSGKYVNRFPYLTNIQVEYYLENYGGV